MLFELIFSESILTLQTVLFFVEHLKCPFIVFMVDVHSDDTNNTNN